MKVTVLIRKKIPWHENSILNNLQPSARKSFEDFDKRSGVSFFTLRFYIVRYSFYSISTITSNLGATLRWNFTDELDSINSFSDEFIREIVVSGDPDIIIPLDDDDFLSCELIKILTNIPMEMIPMAKYVIWPSFELNYVEGWNRLSCYIKNDKYIPTTILPSSYGIILNKETKEKIASKDSSECYECSKLSDLLDCRKFSMEVFNDRKELSPWEIINLDYGSALAFRPYTLATEYYLKDSKHCSHSTFSEDEIKEFARQHPHLGSVPSDINELLMGLNI